MTITLDGAGGLFSIFRDVISAFESANTSQGTTIPTLVDAILTEMGDSDTVAGKPLADSLVKATAANRDQLAFQSALRAYFRGIIINRVTADAPQVPPNITDCINELIRQMEASSDTVERNVVSASVATNPGADAPTLLVSDTGPDGRTLQQMVPETIVGVYSNEASLSLSSGAAINRLSYAWPDGSALRQSLALETAGLLSNPSFDDSSDRADTPDGWIVNVGTIGTTITLTDTEVQTITITGSPTSGHFVIKHTRSDGFEQSTTPLAYNASAADVEAALQALVGLSDVSVTLAGAVYTVNFNGVAPPGNQTALSVTNTFDTGGTSVAETTAGENAHDYRALALLGNGAELTHARQAVQGILSPNTVYAFSIQGKKIAATTGTLIIELTDGANSVMTDDEGTNNRITLDLSTLSDSAFGVTTGFFRTPKVMPAVAYFNLRLSVAIPATKGVYLDSCLLSAARQLYTPGGPYGALMSNDRDLQIGDRYTVTVANNLAGNIQTRFGQFFERQLPSDVSASETISDT